MAACSIFSTVASGAATASAFAAIALTRTSAERGAKETVADTEKCAGRPAANPFVPLGAFLEGSAPVFLGVPIINVQERPQCTCRSSPPFTVSRKLWLVRHAGIPTFLGMTERELIDRLGLPDEIIGPEDRIRSCAWICFACGDTTVSLTPIPCPLPCWCCGGVMFQTWKAQCLESPQSRCGR
jgi:hypothetical protein